MQKSIKKQLHCDFYVEIKQIYLISQFKSFQNEKFIDFKAREITFQLKTN